MSSGNEKRIEAIRTKRDQLNAEIARLEARSRADARKADTRRKILVGAIELEEMAKRANFDSLVRKLLEEGLTRPRDRALFGLPLLESNQDNEPPSSVAGLMGGEAGSLPHPTEIARG